MEPEQEARLLDIMADLHETFKRRVRESRWVGVTGQIVVLLPCAACCRRGYAPCDGPVGPTGSTPVHPMLACRGDRLKGDVAELFSGRAWTGRQALELGLVGKR